MDLLAIRNYIAQGNLNLCFTLEIATGLAILVPYIKTITGPSLRNDTCNLKGKTKEQPSFLVNEECLVLLNNLQ
jgi:hypothetical protein